MDANQYRRLREVFDHAQELFGEDRRRYVAEAVPDDDLLRSELKKLLEAADQIEHSTGLAAGSRLGRYRIEKQIGSGGFAETYLAVDLELEGKRVVLKRPRPALAADRVWQERHFRDEVRTLASVSHPGIVDILDSDIDLEFGPFLVLQYIEGPTLRDLAGQGGLSRARIGRLLTKCTQALAAAHAAGIIHRDLKPENVLVRFAGKSEETPVLIDFGISSFAPPGQQEALTTRVVGSPDYLAPEQAMGHVTTQSDIYSLGCMAIEMLTGERLHRVIKGEHPETAALRLLGNCRPAIDQPTRRSIASAVSFSPTGRPHSALELVDVFGSLSQPAAMLAKRAWIALALVLAAAIFAAFRVMPGAGLQTSPPVAVASQQLTLDMEIRLISRGAAAPIPPDGARVRLGDELQLNLWLSPAAFIYVFGESSSGSGGSRNIAVLFPVRRSAKRDASLTELSYSRARAELTVQFDDHPGQERIWIAASRAAIAQLDRIVLESTRNLTGTVREEADRQALLSFLASHPQQPPRSRASTDSGVLITSIGLDHVK